MRPLSTGELLEVWEQGADRPAAEQSLLLLKAAAGEDEDASTFTIGQRDARLLQLRQWMFGSRLANTATCPRCGQKVEWENDVSEFNLQPVLKSNDERVLQLSKDGFEITFRLPVTNDLLQLHPHRPTAENVNSLLHRCLVEIKKDGRLYDVTDLPVDVLEAVEERMGEVEPQANITLAASCPECSNVWQIVFDIQRYLWIEINDWIKNLLQEIYVLAKHLAGPSRISFR